MKKLLLSLSIVAFAFAQDMVIASDSEAETETVSTKATKVKEGAKKIAKKAKEKGKQVVKAVGDKVSKIKRKVTGDLTEEEMAEERAKKKDKAAKSLAKTQDKELEKQQKQLVKQARETFKNSKKIQEIVEGVGKKVRDAGICKADQMPETVEDLRKNIRLERVTSGMSHMGRSLNNALCHFEIAVKAKDKNAKEEEKNQIALQMKDITHEVTEFVRCVAQLCAIFEDSPDKKMYNYKDVLKAFEKLEIDAAKILSNYDKLKTLAEDTDDTYVLGFLEIIKKAINVCAVIFTDVAKELTRLVKNPSKGTERLSDATKKALSAVGMEEGTFDTMLDAAKQEIAGTSETSAESKDESEHEGEGDEEVQGEEVIAL